MEAFLDNSQRHSAKFVQFPNGHKQKKSDARLYVLPRSEMPETRLQQNATATHALLARPSGEYSRPRDAIGFMMSVTIAKEYFQQLQQIITFVSGSEETVLRSEPVPGSDSIRVWLNSGRFAMDRLMSAIMRGLPSGEFGRIIPA